MKDGNPFTELPTTTQPNRLSESAAADVVLCRDGADIVSPVRATWPARCVRCNVAVTAPKHSITLSWFPFWVYLVGLMGFLFGVLVWWWTRRQAWLTVGVCGECREARQRRMNACWGALAVSGLGLYLAVGASPVFTWVAAVTGLASLIGLVRYDALVSVRRIEGDRAWVRAGPAFANSLATGTPSFASLDQALIAGSRPNLED